METPIRSIACLSLFDSAETTSLMLLPLYCCVHVFLVQFHSALTLCILMDSSFWFDT